MDLCLASSLAGKSLHVSAWDVCTGVVHRVYSCEASSTEDAAIGRACVCVLGHDHILCSSPVLPIIHVWNSNKEQAQLKIACPGVVVALAGSHDGTLCAAAISDKVYIWEVSTGHLLAVASLHYQPVRVLQFTNDGVHLLSGGDDCRVVVWRVARVLANAFDSSGYHFPHTHRTPTSLSSDTSLTRHVWSHHSQPVTSLCCGRGGSDSRVATASLDQTCKLYELSTGTLLCSILFDFGLTAVTMDLNEYFLFVGGSNGQISQVNLFTHAGSETQGLSLTNGDSEDSSRQSQFTGHMKPITGLAMATWAHQLISSSQEDTVRVWDVASHQTVREIKLKGPVTALIKPDLGFTLTKSPESTSAWLTPPPLLLQPFKKQLHYRRNEEERSEGNPVPIQLRRRVDPLCDLAFLSELECGHSLPALSSQPSKSLAEHKVRQEVSEVKEVNKKLFKFMMEQLFEPSPDIRDR